MAFKFPFTNYHELNLTWVLEQLKKLFEESEENVETIETYDNRLSAVETEVTDLESTTTQAINTANAAATNAATALSRANTANQNALTASSQAGAAVTAAQESQQEAQAATQAAQQAQATAMTFDGRITQAQNDASAAVHEAEGFENRVNAAINTANNAANTATIAQGIAVNANQTAAQALDELNAQRDELESIAAGLIDDINDEADAEKQDIQNLADSVIASIPSDYTQLSADVKNKAPVIVANASGEIASFKDGADDMEIRHLLATINPIQAGTGEPSPSNVRAISGRTSLSGARMGKNLFPQKIVNLGRPNVRTANIYFGTPIKPGNYIMSFDRSGDVTSCEIGLYGESAAVGTVDINTGKVTVTGTAVRAYLYISQTEFDNNKTLTLDNIQLEVGSTASAYEEYQGDTISVSWSDAAGTVYGGTIDIITGELTVTDAMADLGTLNWEKNDSSLIRVPCFYATVPGIKPGVRLIACSAYEVVQDRYYIVQNAQIAIGNLSDATYAIVRDDAYASKTASDFKTAMSGVQLVYELATPTVYHLDPITVKTLVGYNNIYTDCGPVSVDYPADTKLYIDGKFAELQALVLEN